MMLGLCTLRRDSCFADVPTNPSESTHHVERVTLGARNAK